MDSPEKKTMSDTVIKTAQVIILLYSAATAAQGLYKMTHEGLTLLDNKWENRARKRHLKAVS